MPCALMHTLLSTTRPIIGARTEQPLLALTFDDGPDPCGTPAVLDVLARHDARATFFVLGRNAVRHPALLQRIAADGHQIANHTDTHRCVVGLSLPALAEELRRCARALPPGEARWMRPPFGAIDARGCAFAALLGYRIVNWSISGDDWRGFDARTIAEHILAELRPGAVVLLHDGLEPPPTGWGDSTAALRDRRPTIDALDQVLDAAQARGYECVTVEALLRRAAPARS